MSTLILQTALMLLGAYFLGAWLACVVRRSTMSYHADDAVSAQPTARVATGLPTTTAADDAARAPVRRTDVTPVATKIETITRPATAAVPTLAPTPAVTVPAPAASVTVKAPMPTAPAVVPTPTVAATVPIVTPTVDSTTRFQDALTGGPRPAAPLSAPAVSATVATAATSAAAAAATVAATAAAAAKVLTPTVPVLPTIEAAKPLAPAPIPVSVPVAPFNIPTPGPTRTGVSLPVAAGSSGQTSAAAPLAPMFVPPAPVAVPTPVTPAAMPPVTVAPTTTPTTTPTAGADDLSRIRAIDSGVHAKLHQLGVRRYADIAAWTPADVTRISNSLGFHGRIEQENWIEQAQILSRGGETAFARRKDRGEVTLATPSADVGIAKAIQTAPITKPAPAVAVQAAPAQTVAQPVAEAIKPGVAPSRVAPSVAVPSAPAQVPMLPPLITPTPVVASATAPIVPAPSAPVVAAAVAPVAAATAAVVGPKVADLAAFAAPAKVAVTAAAPVIASVTAPVPVVAAPAAAVLPAAIAPSPEIDRPLSALGRDNLQRIGGINAEVERVLNVQGVSKYSQIAGWGEKDTTRFDRLLGYEGRIARENWIEQAQILSRNGETAYSRQFDQQIGSKSAATVIAATATPTTAPKPEVVASVAAVTPVVTAPAVTTPAAVTIAPVVIAPVVTVPAATAPVVTTPVVSAPAAVAATVAAVTAAASAAVAKVATTAAPVVADAARPVRLPDTVVDAVKTVISAAPVVVAAIVPTAAAAVAPVVAAAISTVPAAVAAVPKDVSAMPLPTRTGELAGLRSVRSEAYAPASSKSGPDDLKRIRGVGVLIERKLNTMGVNNYSQIANWTAAEIDRVSQVLDFKGKVERENWVEQARILSAGGQTEFSRHADHSAGKPK